ITTNSSHSPMGTTTTSIAMAIPEVNLVHFQSQSPMSPYGMSPDGFHFQLTEEDILRNRALEEEERKEEEAKQLLVDEANLKWDATIRKWKSEMGDQAGILDDDDVEDDLNVDEDQEESCEP